MSTQIKTRPRLKGGRVFSKLFRAFAGNRVDSWSIVTISMAVGAIMILPAVYIIIKAFGADLGVWPKLWSTKIPSLLVSTISLTVSATALTVIIAVPSAWLVSMTDLPGRKIWQWLLALPLAIPPYIGSFAYITLMGPKGLIFSLPIYSFTGTLIIMSVFTYPYVFLLVTAAFKSQNQSLIDAARASGMRLWQVLLKVTLPLIRPSIVAGSLLVALYVLSDFGAIRLLRYPTFTSAIYQQLTGRYNLEAAAALSTVLMILTVAVVWLEWRSRAKVRYFQTGGIYRPVQLVKLKAYKGPALAFILSVFIIGLVLPLCVLFYWSVLGIKQGVLDFSFVNYTLNSVLSSGIAATAAVFLALPVVYLAGRHPSVMSHTIWRLSYAGYALPGVIVGLGMVFLFNSALPWLYGTVLVLILAYIVRFFPQSLQSQESALAAIAPNMEEAAKSFGFGIFSIFRKVTIPLMLPAVAASWILIFISCMKELPATLLLRPAGFDTLAVRVWVDASEGYFALGAPVALLLVLFSAGPLAYITQRKQVLRKTAKPLGTVEDVSSTTG